MSSLNDHMPAVEVKNRSYGMGFQVSNSTRPWKAEDFIKRDSWYSEMALNFCLPALLMAEFIDDAIWKDRCVRTMIFLLSFSIVKQAFRRDHEVWTLELLSRHRASAFPLLAFIITACIDDVVWKDRVVWAIIHLVIAHLIGQVFRVILEPIETALELILDNFLPKQPLGYSSTWLMPMPAVEVENQSSGTSLGVLPVPFSHLAFLYKEAIDNDFELDRYVWAMILVFTFYTARQAFLLAHELWTTVCMSRQHARADNQSSRTSFRVSELVGIRMRKHFIKRVFLLWGVLDMMLSLLAFVTMACMGDGDWNYRLDWNRRLRAIMFLLNLSTAFQLFQLFLVLLAVSHFLKQRASPSASLARNLPSTSPTMSASSQRDSLSLKPRRTYDVFLSFFGKDCRNGFVGHLYSALKHKGILIYRDDKNLEQGTYISQELLKAIQESKYAIVVISKNYAFSKWCLMEVTHIMKCMIETQLIVLPVFYHVDPSHVRNQQGSFANAFAMHMRNLKVFEEEMKAWKAALEKVGGLAGWHVHERYEAEFVEEISRTIFIGLCGNLSNFEKNLVGMESQVGNLINLLEMDGVSFIGICGMGGIGKTTLAKFIYDRFSSEFEANSFIDVKEGSKSLVDMQRQLISEILKESKIELWNTHQGFRIIRDRVCNKKVLIVLDNLEEEAQIKKLVGSKDWHHQGSKILITSRDRQLLNKYVDKIYDVEKLGENDALQLFSWKAFQNPHPKENYLEMSKDIVKYAEGLPLAIEVFGSSLFDKTMDEWRSAQDLFKLHPQAEILDKLKVSYDGLEEIQKDLFLDIVFFFNGSFVSEIVDILDSCDYYLEFNVSVLKDRSLIKILDDKRIEVHDLLVKMGHQIVNSKSSGLLGKHSRLYRQKDIIDIMKNNIGTDMVEGIVLELPLQKNESLNLEAFSKMTNLRILLIKNKSIYPETNNEFWEDLHTLKWEKDPSNFNLSNKLCVITWWGYPLQSLPSNFQSDNLVKLQMPHSYINKLWDGKKSFGKLKEIDLKDSKNLIETPNFCGAPNLEKLVFSFCTSLSTVHSSIRFVKQLQVLDLKGCHCLKELSESGNGWKYLEEVDIKGTTIRKLSSRILDVESESNPTSFLLMKSSSSFSSLTNLNLSYCNMLDDTFFSGLGYLSSLKFLDLSGNKFTRIPEFVYQLSNLEELLLRHCNGIQALQKPLFSHLKSLKILDFGYSNLTNDTILNDIGCLFSLQSLCLEENKFTRIPNSISQLSNLLLLKLDNCCSLQALPKLPARPLLLSVRNCTLLEKLYSQTDARTSNEMMLTSDFSAIAIYVGYDGKPYMSLYVQPEKSFQTKDEGKILLNGVAWGLAQGSKIPGWFNQRSINSSGTIQSCVKLDDYSNNWEGYALFIVYQVHELDSFQREIKSENADEFEKSNSRVLFRNNLVFPEFSCQLQVDEGGPRRSFIFRIPEVVPVGSNGVWVYITIPCFDEVMNVLTRLAYLSVSIATKSPNVEVKECGARLVPDHDHSEFYQVVSSISPQVLDETSLKDICCPCLSLWGL